MEQHPIPRQITTFEFKLIGFMTLKQFLYLVVFIPTAFVVWKLVPIPIVNIICGALVAGLGVAVAFLPINDRPMDVWLKNFMRRITSPTQYLYHKQNSSLAFLNDLYFVTDPHKILSHIETQEKLTAYLQQTKSKSKTQDEPTIQKKQQIQTLLQNPLIAVPQTNQPAQVVTTEQSSVSSKVSVAQPPTPHMTYRAESVPSPQQPQIIHGPATHPFMTGIIKNNKKIPLPGILVYIKDLQDKPIRLLKTNPHGVFATFNALPQGEYFVEMKDPNGGYFFDRMKITIGGAQQPSYEFYSKEIM